MIIKQKNVGTPYRKEDKKEEVIIHIYVCELIINNDMVEMGKVACISKAGSFSKIRNDSLAGQSGKHAANTYH